MTSKCYLKIDSSGKVYWTEAEKHLKAATGAVSKIACSSSRNPLKVDANGAVYTTEPDTQMNFIRRVINQATDFMRKDPVAKALADGSTISNPFNVEPGSGWCNGQRESVGSIVENSAGWCKSPVKTSPQVENEIFKSLFRGMKCHPSPSSSVTPSSAVPTVTDSDNLLRVYKDAISHFQIKELIREKMNEAIKPAECPGLPKKKVFGDRWFDYPLATITLVLLAATLMFMLGMVIGHSGFWYAMKYPGSRIPKPVRFCMNQVAKLDKREAAYHRRLAVARAESVEVDMEILQRIETAEKTLSKKKDTAEKTQQKEVSVEQKETSTPSTPSENLGGENWEVDCCTCGSKTTAENAS